MVSSITGTQSSDTLAGIYSQPTTPSGSTSSFTDQLAAALEGYLAQSGKNSNLEIDIQTTQSQDSGGSQFLVTVKNPDSATADVRWGNHLLRFPHKRSYTSGSYTGCFHAGCGFAERIAGGENPGQPQMAEIDAYWAAQPPAVQQLRNVSDFGARSAMAQHLADQGYTIDRAIMVWGWDPLKTMATRQMYGYTWVPSYNQAIGIFTRTWRFPARHPMTRLIHLPVRSR